LSYDHTYLLGNTLAEIAGEKGGIIKPGVPVVLAPQEDEARMVIEKIAAERGSPLIQVGSDLLYAPLEHSLDGQTLQVWARADQEKMDQAVEAGGSNGWTPTRLQIPLLGYFQVENAATAYAALQVFSQRALPIRADAIQQGFHTVRWPGRFEILQRNPPVVVDSAHNRDSARKLRVALDDYFPGKEVVLVFGASEDKDIHGMFAELMPRVDQVIATQSFHPRAIAPEPLIELAHQFGKQVHSVPDVADALQEALRLAGDDKLVLVAGSIFVTAGAREAWQAHSSTAHPS
jgi:dihydrofolate synthase / folylpolyglutamate synthase